MAKRPVTLADYDPEWPRSAEAHARRLGVLGPVLVAVHHVGSTAVPGLVAKPVIDLLAMVTSLADLDQRRERLEALGYDWRHENGVSGRRYCVLTAPDGGRIVQLHCFAQGSWHVARHLAFRDYLRAHPAVAHAYAAEKHRARNVYPDDSAAYTDEKMAWTNAKVLTALAWWRTQSSSS